MSAEKQIPTADERSSFGETSLFSLGHCRAFWTTAMRGIRLMDLPPWEIGRRTRVVPNKKRDADFSAARRHPQDCLSV